MTRQIETVDLLNPSAFLMSINRLPGLEFFVESVSIPGWTIGQPTQPTMFKDVMWQGDKIESDDLSMTFKIDKELRTWIEIHNWMKRIAFPTSFKDVKATDPFNPKTSTETANLTNEKSDITITILSPKKTPMCEFVFLNAFPTSLGGFDMDINNTDETSTTVTFGFSDFTIKALQ